MADSPQTFATALFRVWAIVTPGDGSAPINFGDETNGGDIVSISATFSLNTIPTATLVVATGRNAITGKLATIHERKKNLRSRDKVVVYVRIIPGPSGDAEKVKQGKYKIFEGYLAGVGYQRSNNQANYVLNLIHWLDDLNNSSAVNGDWLPGAPADYARAALVTTVGRVGTLNAYPNVSDKFATVMNARDDLWAKTIKPICEEIAGFPAIAQLAPGAVKNDAAKKALERMPGNGGYRGAGGKGYYRALKFRAPITGRLNIDRSLANYFRDVFADSTAQNSFWAKIVTSLAAEFMFAISPAVDWALPIPFCAGVQWVDGCPVIQASEYSYANFTTNMAQMIEAVHVVYPLGSYTNVPGEIDTTTPPESRSYFYPYASWPPPSPAGASSMRETRGLKLFKTPPGWLNNADAASLCGLSSILGAGTTTGGGSSDRLPAGVDTTTASYNAADNTTVDFARHWYLTEVLQQRVGELSGPVRFDIAPGSIVKIITPQRDKIIEPENDHVIASVISVSYVINSERATAGTSFTVAHTKTPTEALDPYYSTQRPPLYGEGDIDPSATFYGAPLADPE